MKQTFPLHVLVAAGIKQREQPSHASPGSERAFERNHPARQFTPLVGILNLDLARNHNLASRLESKIKIRIQSKKRSTELNSTAVGPGRGGTLLLDSPSPRSSPHSFLAGRGRRSEAVTSLNSTRAVRVSHPSRNFVGYTCGGIVLRIAAAVVGWILLFSLATAVHAASNINPNQALAWASNIGWTNWRPDSENGAQIGEYVCSGFVYSANAGWINLGNGHPANGIQYQNNSGADFGVNRDALGNLRGLAYGANIGWIAFETNGAPRVDLATGKLSGSAYSSNAGWITLGNATLALQVDTILAGADSDSDGIPDAWEFAHGGNLTTFGRGTDADLDGQSDFEEYLSDTDPLDPNDSLRILGFALSPDRRAATLAWKTSPTRQYVVQTRLDLSSGAWTESMAGLQMGDGAARTVTLTNPVGNSQSFFRIQAIRPLAQ